MTLHASKDVNLNGGLLALTDVFIRTAYSVHLQDPMTKNFKSILGWDSNHDFLLTSADVTANSTTKLAGAEWPIFTFLQHLVPHLHLVLQLT